MNSLPQTDRKLALKAHDQVKFFSYPVQSEDYFPEWKPAFNARRCFHSRSSSCNNLQLFVKDIWFNLTIHKGNTRAIFKGLVYCLVQRRIKTYYSCCLLSITNPPIEIANIGIFLIVLHRRNLGSKSTHCGSERFFYI